MIPERQSNDKRKSYTLLMVSNPNLVDGLLHLHQAQVGQRGLDEVHDGLQALVLQDQRLVASQQAHGHLEDDL